MSEGLDFKMKYIISYANESVYLAHFSITANNGDEALKRFHNIIGEDAQIKEFRRISG